MNLNSLQESIQNIENVYTKQNNTNYIQAFIPVYYDEEHKLDCIGIYKNYDDCLKNIFFYVLSQDDILGYNKLREMFQTSPEGNKIFINDGSENSLLILELFGNKNIEFITHYINYENNIFPYHLISSDIDYTHFMNYHLNCGTYWTFKIFEKYYRL